MLVRQLVGANAGAEFYMKFEDAVRASKNGTVELVNHAEAARFVADEGDATEEIVPMATEIPVMQGKRRGGWPKGKKRGPRAARQAPSAVSPALA